MQWLNAWPKYLITGLVTSRREKRVNIGKTTWHIERMAFRTFESCRWTTSLSWTLRCSRTVVWCPWWTCGCCSLWIGASGAGLLWTSTNRANLWDFFLGWKTWKHKNWFYSQNKVTNLKISGIISIIYWNFFSYYLFFLYLATNIFNIFYVFRIFLFP